MLGTIESMVMDLVAKVEFARGEALKFDKGNKAAGTRVTKSLQEVAKAIKPIRQAVFERRKQTT